MTPKDKQLLWSVRWCLTDKPHMVGKVMLSVPWFSAPHRADAARLLRVWKKSRVPAEALAVRRSIDSPVTKQLL